MSTNSQKDSTWKELVSSYWFSLNFSFTIKYSVYLY